MNKEELRKKLEPKKFNNVTMEFLTKAVNDVLESYGEYISEDVIIERIKQNLDKDIEFKEEIDNGLAGKYCVDLKTIMIKKECLDKEKQTFLHEFLHCISTHKKNNSNISVGFCDGKKGMGINEAITEYLTEQKYPELRSYQDEKKVLEKLLEIIPKKEMIQSYLYGEPEIEKLIEKYGMNRFNLLLSFDELLNNNKKYNGIGRIFTIGLDDIERIDASQRLIFEYVKGYCNLRKLEEINIEELMNNIDELEKILFNPEHKSDFDYMQYVNRIIAEKLQQGTDEEKLRQLPARYIDRINHQRAKEKIYNKPRERILSEDFSKGKDTYENFFEDEMYMEKIIQKICGYCTGFEDDTIKFYWATLLWNEIKQRYSDINFDWIDFGFIDDKYIIARIGRIVVGAMNIDIDDEEEYKKYKEVIEVEKGSEKYRIISKDNEYVDINESQDERLEMLREEKFRLERLKSVDAPSIVIKSMEERIEELSQTEQKHKVEYAKSYLVRQKAFGEIEENEYNVEVQKMDEWINRHYQESPVDDFER